MINANKIITLYHFDEDGEMWEKAVYTASVNGRINAVIGRGEIKYDNIYVVRIPTDDNIAVQVGDRIYWGEIENTEPPTADDVMCVTAFADNRRGSPQMRHWRIDCK